MNYEYNSNYDVNNDNDKFKVSTNGRQQQR